MLKNVAGRFAWKGKKNQRLGTPLRVVRAVAVVTAEMLSFLSFSVPILGFSQLPLVRG